MWGYDFQVFPECFLVRAPCIKLQEKRVGPFSYLNTLNLVEEELVEKWGFASARFVYWLVSRNQRALLQNQKAQNLSCFKTRCISKFLVNVPENLCVFRVIDIPVEFSGLEAMSGEEHF